MQEKIDGMRQYVHELVQRGDCAFPVLRASYRVEREITLDRYKPPDLSQAPVHPECRGLEEQLVAGAYQESLLPRQREDLDRFGGPQGKRLLDIHVRPVAQRHFRQRLVGFGRRADVDHIRPGLAEEFIRAGVTRDSVSERRMQFAFPQHGVGNRH